MQSSWNFFCNFPIINLNSINSNLNVELWLNISKRHLCRARNFVFICFLGTRTRKMKISLQDCYFSLFPVFFFFFKLKTFTCYDKFPCHKVAKWQFFSCCAFMFNLRCLIEHTCVTIYNFHFSMHVRHLYLGLMYTQPIFQYILLLVDRQTPCNDAVNIKIPLI